MIFYHSTLMPTVDHGMIAGVATDEEVTNYQQHAEMIYIRLYHLVLEEIEHETDLVTALQDKLGIEYDGPLSAYGIANALHDSEVMSDYFMALERHWEAYLEMEDPKPETAPFQDEFSDWDLVDLMDALSRIRKE